MQMRFGKIDPKLPRAPSALSELQTIEYVETRVNWTVHRPVIELLVVSKNHQSVLIRMTGQAARSLGQQLLQQGDTLLLTMRHKDRRKWAP